MQSLFEERFVASCSLRNDLVKYTVDLLNQDGTSGLFSCEINHGQVFLQIYKTGQ